jgi:AcrR family transcriptional regulator
MARRIPDRRFTELAECAARVFIEHGYRRTQMSDVADALGVAKGTLYLYVESKEALFDLALRCADAPGRIETPARLPIRTPKPGATVAYVRRRLAESQPLAALAAALGRKRAREPRRELEEIVREMYGVLVRNRRGIKLLDRSAADHPELAALWFEGGREGLMGGLEQYLHARIAAGQLRAVPDIPAAARLIIEVTAFWAVHRHWDPHPQTIDDAVAEATVVRFVVGALVKE